MATVLETYAAALQHDRADLPDGTRRIGVVRRPMGWFHGVVDENLPALGPPDGLLDEVKAQQATLEDEGHSDTDALHRAWEDVDFASRYDAYLAADPDASAAQDRLVETVEDGTTVALVCYESSDKPCHRHRLRERLLERLEG